MEVTPEGRVVLLTGSQANGQGHRTAFAQVASEILGLSIDDIDVVQGDTARIATGGGTGGSKSVPLGAVLDGAGITAAGGRTEEARLDRAGSLGRRPGTRGGRRAREGHGQIR